MTRALLRILALALAALFFAVPARAETVTAAKVCNVQSALRWSRPAWTERRCREVAAALSVLPEPATMLAVLANESNMRADAIRRGGADVYDIGLAGIRCRVENGRCTNGPARGYTVGQLMDPVVNVIVAHVLATVKGARWLQRWNGDPGYAERIHVLAAAIRGEEVEVRGKGPKWKRIRELVRRIVAARANERKS